MKFTKIISNPPFGKIGVDITNIIMDEIPHEDIVILGTRAMLCKHNERLALEYCYIEDYVLNPVIKCKWVRQIILLGYKGCCKVIPAICYRSNLKEKPNEIRVQFSYTHGGQTRISLNTLLTRSRETAVMISLSDEDYEYLKEHWAEMDYVQRFWWLHEHGLYNRFVPIDLIKNLYTEY